MFDDPLIQWAMIISSGLLVLFNTASVVAMSRHHAEDKEYIYGLDISTSMKNGVAKNNARVI